MVVCSRYERIRIVTEFAVIGILSYVKASISLVKRSNMGFEEVG